MTNKNIMLSDGTNVQLNAGSTLSYSKDYNSGSREVFLNGEAYFNVTKNHVPFIVSTDYAQITVLGTKFNVRSRSDGFEAGVNEGSVEVTNNDKSIVLIEGERALIHSTSHSTIDSSSTSNYYPGWLNNKIVCDNTPLEKICKEIERTYNIKILIEDNSLKRLSISGIINLYPNNLNSVMSSISLLAQREFKLEGETYIIL
jgi:ferric-dicitrate binding protein FerR (iron transport regulator)